MHDFFAGRRVLLTGHTGFKGGWLALWLRELGAAVTGFGGPPPTEPAQFALARVAHDLEDVRGDVRDRAALDASVVAARPRSCSTSRRSPSCGGHGASPPRRSRSTRTAPCTCSTPAARTRPARRSRRGRPPRARPDPRSRAARLERALGPRPRRRRDRG